MGDCRLESSDGVNYSVACGLKHYGIVVVIADPGRDEDVRAGCSAIECPGQSTLSPFEVPGVC
jgi:hypothetical protein